MQKVAVITRTKNRPLLLQRCVLSVLNQTYQDWLHVIVNDGGDPTTVEGVVARFTERYRGRVKIIHNETSVGMQNASNLGIRSVESEFIGIHDDDDTWQEMFLEECVGYLETAGVESREQGVAAQSIWVMEEVDSWGNIVELSRQDYLPFESISLFQAAAKNPFPPIAFLYRRRAHDKVGYFDQEFNELGDHDFNLRFLSHYDIGTISKRLAGYHWRHRANGSNYGNTVTDGVASHRKMLVKMQNHYLRQDLANQRLGLGFLLNISANMDAQIGWVHGLYVKSDKVTDSLRQVVKKLQFYERLVDTVLMPWKGKALPRRFYDHVMDLMSPSSDDEPIKNGDNHVPSLEGGMAKERIISLDVFDTALLRLVRKPVDVFLYMQSDVRRLLGRPSLGFVEARVAAEHEAREEKRRAAASGEVTLDEIYSAMRVRLGCDEATVGRIKQWELEVERKLCYANPSIAQLTARAENGKKIIFASDMYLPAGEIIALLEKNGFKNAPLFLSCELQVSKHEGGLFDRVLKTLQCEPAEMLHIGDNAHSDVDRARAKGIRAYHWKPAPSQVPLVDQHTSYSGAWDGDLASSLYTGLVRRRRLERPLANAHGAALWEMMGYELVGPLYHSFVSWVITRAARLGLKRVYFLARDGFQLVKVFQLLREKHELEIEAAYLFASRRLWNIARIDKLDEENLAFLATPNPCMRVGDFLARAGIVPAPHAETVRKFGFRSLDERVTTSRGTFISEAQHQDMRRLLREFESEIVAQAARERIKLLAYFEEVGLMRDGNGIVDIGWQASSLKSLHKVLALAGEPRKIPGFYFGTWHFAQPVVDAGHPFESFFFHLDKPFQRSSIVGEGVELLESLFTAPHATITGLEKQNGKWEPIYGEAETDGSTEAALEAVTGAAFEFVRDALAIWPEGQELAPPFGYLETVMERLLRHPQKEEAEAFGKFSLRNTFGGSGPLRQLANPPSSLARISRREALQHAYDECYWKKGFLAQLSTRARKYIKF
jgi:glycosyltransferase involved in cell wall biosynthesis